MAYGEGFSTLTPQTASKAQVGVSDSLLLDRYWLFDYDILTTE